MTAQNGSSFLIKMSGVGSPDADYDTVAGMRTKTLRVNNQPVDVTDQDSGGWAEKLAGAGIRSVTVSGSGVFKNSIYEAQFKTAAMANSHLSLKIVVPGLGTFTGTFAVTDYTLTGAHDSAVTQDVTLESTGEVTFA